MYKICFFTESKLRRVENFNLEELCGLVDADSQQEKMSGGLDWSFDLNEDQYFLKAIDEALKEVCLDLMFFYCWFRVY